MLDHFPDSIPMLDQCWPNVGKSVGLMLAAKVGPTAFWPVELTLAQRRQATGKKIYSMCNISQSDCSMVLCGHFLTEGE